MDSKQRRDLLVNKLSLRGLKLRKDSALCSQYIAGNCDLDPDYIVQRMCQMHYLYNYCHMEQIKKQVYREHLEELVMGNAQEGTVSSRAEKIALDTHSNGLYPDKFPWENTSGSICESLDGDNNKNKNYVSLLANTLMVIGFYLIGINIAAMVWKYNI